ncbi:hypothetical protein IAT40_004348 [Kwoniella sp. CBS 6097]
MTARSAASTHKEEPDMIILQCRWDFCTETFLTFAEWETHFAIEHIAHARPIKLAGRKRCMREDGYWELVEEEAGPREHLPLQQDASQTTGDITTTTHTLSFPLPPSFHSVASPTTPFPTTTGISPLAPEESYLDQHQHSQQSEEEERAHAAAREAENERLYQTFLRSPSLSPLQSGSGSLSASYQPPPPGQRLPNSSWIPAHSQSPSQPLPTSQVTRGSNLDTSNPSPPVSAVSDVFSVELPRTAESPLRPSHYVTFFPSNSTSRSLDDISQSQSSQDSSKTSQAFVNRRTHPVSNLRFGSALGKGDTSSPPATKERHAAPKSTAVGFSWGSG